MPSPPLRRRKRDIEEALKTARKRFRLFKEASSRCLGSNLIRKTAMRLRLGPELACCEAGLNAQSMSAKNLILQREEIGLLFQLGRGSLGSGFRETGMLRV